MAGVSVFFTPEQPKKALPYGASLHKGIGVSVVSVIEKASKQGGPWVAL